MGERKVLNKYFPPDFDPAKLPRGKRPDNNMMKVRMMLPMSIRCQTCGTYMYKGTKFNTRKEDVEGENYLGIQVFRFYFRCNACAAEMTMKTDPEHADYTVEMGATRNYEPWREKDRAVAEAAAAREEEERGNAMKALENRTLDSKREMDIMNALDEMKSLKARQERVDSAALLNALQRSADDDGAPLDDDDEAAVKAMLMQQRGFVRRLEDPASAEQEQRGAQASLHAQEAGAAGASAHSGAVSADAPESGSGGGMALGQLMATPLASLSAKQPSRPAAKPRLLPMVLKAKRKAEEPATDSTAAAGEPPVKRQEGGVQGVAKEEGGLDGLLGYGTGTDSD